MSLTGEKKDEGKLRFDLVPLLAEREIVKVFTFGAKKYGDRNWEKGIAYSRLIAAAKRHISQFLTETMNDSECGTHHLANAAVDLMMIVQFDLERRYTLNDISTSEPTGDGLLTREEMDALISSVTVPKGTSFSPETTIQHIDV